VSKLFGKSSEKGAADMDIDRDLELLLSSVDKIEASYGNRFLDKSSAERVAAAQKNDESASHIPAAPLRPPPAPDRAAPAVVREAGGKVWADPTLSEWPPNDYRIHVQNLPPDASDHDLADAFRHYKSFAKAKVIFDSSGRHKQYGFVSLLDMNDYIDAMKTMANAFIKSRRVTLAPSKWKDKSRGCS
jgi:hypothetical protein